MPERDARLYILFGRYCDLFERMWQEEHGTPLDPDDGLLHTSDKARAFATDLIDSLSSEGLI